jgi:hypothetical protein
MGKMEQAVAMLDKAFKPPQKEPVTIQVTQNLTIKFYANLNGAPTAPSGCTDKVGNAPIVATQAVLFTTGMFFPVRISQTCSKDKIRCNTQCYIITRLPPVGGSIDQIRGSIWRILLGFTLVMTDLPTSKTGITNTEIPQPMAHP